MTAMCSTFLRGQCGSRGRRCPQAQAASLPWHGQGRLRLLVVLLLSLLSYFFFSRCVMSTVEIRGLSMSPTLHEGDRFLLDRLSCWYRLPHRGDLVVLRDPEHGEFAVKRIVALPQERLEIQKNIAHINGRRLMEPYLPLSALATQDAMMERPQVIPPDHFFVMGDNRNNSEDSRHYGAVPRRNIVGVIHVGSQPAAFLRSLASPVVNQPGVLPLPTISASATERARARSASRP